MISVLLYSLGFVLIIVVTQDIHLFPGAFYSLLTRKKRDPRTLPAGIESDFISTSDQKRLEVWRHESEPSVEKLPFIAVIFHGNGAPLKNFLVVQQWFAALGISNYGFDYRGFGKSSGWPSETGIEEDSDTVWNYVLQREEITPEQVIVLGVSVGCAPAARIAALHQPKMLVLVSAFIDLKTVVDEQLLFGPLSRFLWYRFPTIDYVKQLESADLLLAHGEKDRLIRPYHTKVLQEAYRGSGCVERVTTNAPGHTSTFYATRKVLGQWILERLGVNN